MLKKLIAAAATLAVALGIVALVAVPAQAHDHSVDPTCSALSIRLTNYNGDKSHANTVVVKINGAVVFQNDDFGANLSKSFTPPAGVSYTWEVKVTAWDSNQYSFDQTGTQRGCAAPPAAIAEITPVQATCDADHLGEKTDAAYIIGASQNVTYTASTDGGAPVAVGAGRHEVPIGADQVVVVITAKAADGYQLTGTNPVTLTFHPVASDCLSHLTVSGEPTTM